MQIQNFIHIFPVFDDAGIACVNLSRFVFRPEMASLRCKGFGIAACCVSPGTRCIPTCRQHFAMEPGLGVVVNSARPASRRGLQNWPGATRAGTGRRWNTLTLAEGRRRCCNTLARGGSIWEDLDLQPLTQRITRRCCWRCCCSLRWCTVVGRPANSSWWIDDWGWWIDDWRWWIDGWSVDSAAWLSWLRASSGVFFKTAKIVKRNVTRLTESKKSWTTWISLITLFNYILHFVLSS